MYFRSGVTRLLVVAAVVVLIIVLFSGWARAQDVLVTPPADMGEAMSWLAFVQQILYVLLTGLALPALTLVVQKYLKDRGLNIEQKYVDWANNAARNTAALLLDPHLTTEEKRRLAVERMRRVVPESVEWFRMNDGDIWDLVESYINQQGKSLPEILDNAIMKEAIRNSLEGFTSSRTR